MRRLLPRSIDFRPQRQRSICYRRVCPSVYPSVHHTLESCQRLKISKCISHHTREACF